MGLSGQRSSGRGTGTRGERKSATAQLGAVARRLLLALLVEEERLRTGTPAERLEVENEGIAWNLPQFAEAVAAAPSSTSRALGMLEARRLVCCWARGSGNNRRVLRVKLSAQAVEVAEGERRHPGISEAQYQRRALRQFLEEREADWLADHDLY